MPTMSCTPLPLGKDGLVELYVLVMDPVDQSKPGARPVSLKEEA